MIPLPHLDGNYTVFGRVIEGIEILGLLRQLNLANKEEKKENANPDFIIRAKVLRKRDHEYKPTPVRGKLFK
jgi:cyclophilin family peptidyl-prolyl cis-trans isomerase